MDDLGFPGGVGEILVALPSLMVLLEIIWSPFVLLSTSEELSILKVEFSFFDWDWRPEGPFAEDCCIIRWEGGEQVGLLSFSNFRTDSNSSLLT